MEGHLIALRLYLDELGLEPKIKTLDDRKRIQKAVYLGQAAGADLGYRYSWYVYGPYSPALTIDYFALADNAHDENAKPNYRLHSKLSTPLQNVKSLINPPSQVSLESGEWLELLASVHYQRKVLNKDADGARSYLQSHPRKSALSTYFDDACAALQPIL